MLKKNVCLWVGKFVAAKSKRLRWIAGHSSCDGNKTHTQPESERERVTNSAVRLRINKNGASWRTPGSSCAISCRICVAMLEAY